MTNENPKAPEQSVRLGNVSASIFRNQADSGREFRSVVFQRSYRNDAGELKFSNSFTASDLPVLARVLELTQTQVEKLGGLIDESDQE